MQDTLTTSPFLSTVGWNCRAEGALSVEQMNDVSHGDDDRDAIQGGSIRQLKPLTNSSGNDPTLFRATLAVRTRRRSDDLDASDERLVPVRR